MGLSPLTPRTGAPGGEQGFGKDMAHQAMPGTSLEGIRPTYMYKVVLLGSTSVGKSSLAYRYVKNDFKESLPTVGCSFFTQMLNLEVATVKFEIWDTAGQEKYHSVCHLYYRGAQAALLVYDIANKETLNRAKLWLRDLEKEFLPHEIVIALVGNKTDLAAKREVATEPKSSCSGNKRKHLLRPHTGGQQSTWGRVGRGQGAAGSENEQLWTSAVAG
ncbi:ras-related protein Rab-17 isoform 2-T2 [Spheniscus humboldti]